MANDSGSVAVAEAVDAEELEEEQESKSGFLGALRGKEDEEEEAEHEIEFTTPFGKFELEFEPTTQKERRDRKKREKRERAAAKKATELAARARREAQRAVEKQQKKQGGILGKIVLALVILAIVGGAIAIAYWLFGRRPEELEAESVPPEYRTVDVATAPVEPEGFMPKMRERLRRAVRAGRRASAEAQIEQQAKYEDLTRHGA